MGSDEIASDAELDPWCIVPPFDDSRILFGFALYHPQTLGLSWMHSSPVQHLDAKAGCAVTASGRRYRLGRQITPQDVPAEGEEAWMAFDLLVSAAAEDEEAVPPISADRDRDIKWVSACKMARNLSVAPPDRAPLAYKSLSNGILPRIKNFFG